jgi:hypothetical protein
MRSGRWVRWVLLSGTVVLPSFVLNCDKAALNLQRSFYQSIGAELGSELVGFLPDF